MRTEVFTSGSGDRFREEAERLCILQNLRLEADDLVYNAYGIKVAKYQGGDERGLRFENLRLETEWDQAKVLTRRE